MAAPDGKEVINSLEKYEKHSQDDSLMLHNKPARFVRFDEPGDNIIDTSRLMTISGRDEQPEIRYINDIGSSIIQSVTLTYDNKVAARYENIDGKLVEVIVNDTSPNDASSKDASSKDEFSAIYADLTRNPNEQNAWKKLMGQDK